MYSKTQKIWYVKLEKEGGKILLIDNGAKTNSYPWNGGKSFALVDFLFIC